MTLADNQNISIEMMINNFLEEAQSRISKWRKTANQINHIKLIVNVLFGSEDKEDREKFHQELNIAAKTEHWTVISSIICQHMDIFG